jgi:UDP-glucose 4-epimerase
VTKALVTGGAGFIGAHLVRRLLQTGFEVIVLDDLSWGDPQKVELPGVRLIRDSVLNLAAHRAELAQVTHVFHLAALISAYDSLTQPDTYVQTNVLGLLRVIELCGALQRPRLVFASTSGIYGNTPQAMKSETDFPRPATVYALTKLAGEQLLEMYRDRSSYDDVALRLFNVYGPGQSPNHPYANVTCKFARAAALGEGVALYGDGAQTRDFIYVDDVVEAMLLVGTRPCQHRLYNVGTGERASIASLLELAQAAGDVRLPIEQRPEWPNDIRAIAADCSRLAGEHGFAPKVGLLEGLRRTIQFFRESTSAK